jgi:hypothetical protein
LQDIKNSSDVKKTVKLIKDFFIDSKIDYKDNQHIVQLFNDVE